MEKAINQCDGCNLGLPVDEEGMHYHPENKEYGCTPIHMICTKDLYEVDDAI